MQVEAAFPPNIDDINTHSSVLQYESYIDSVIKRLKCVCEYCDLFILEKEYQIYTIDDCLICNSIMLGLLILSYIDYCAISDNNICLCLICSRLFLLENQPKFEILNGLVHVKYQLYLSALTDLSMAKEIAITYMYQVVSILKLRPSGAFNPTAYSRIKGHMTNLVTSQV